MGIIFAERTALFPYHHNAYKNAITANNIAVINTPALLLFPPPLLNSHATPSATTITIIPSYTIQEAATAIPHDNVPPPPPARQPCRQADQAGQPGSGSRARTRLCWEWSGLTRGLDARRGGRISVALVVFVDRHASPGLSSTPTC